MLEQKHAFAHPKSALDEERKTLLLDAQHNDPSSLMHCGIW